MSNEAQSQGIEIIRMSVKEYALISDKSPQRVNKILKEIETLQRSPRNAYNGYIESRYSLLKGVIGIEWIGKQRVLTVIKPEADGR
jgi:hypothetical protein